jgi:hypothetical protein
MKSITIHGIEEPLAELLQSKARNEGLSMNKTVKKILEESLGVKPLSHEKYRKDFEAFCGIWSESDAKAFEEKTEELRQADPGDWQ